jgi:hypothetical protein
MNKNKKYIFLFAGVIALLVVFAGILFFQQTPPQASPTNTTTSSTSNGGYIGLNATHQNTNGATISPTPQEDAAQLVTRQFYTYYFSYKTNPLANGAYKNSPYISPDFKGIIGALYQNGNLPVFCPVNRSDTIVVGQEQQVPYNNTYLLQEVISQAPPGNKDLYRVLMENVNGKWLIFDVNCI